MAEKRGSRPPWVGLAAAVWVLMAAGNAFTFPLYSPSLKSVLGLDQRQLAMLGVANDIGENVGVFAGVACNCLAPWLILLVGSAASFLGFGVLWLAVSGTLASLPYWVLWIALCIGTNSCAWLSTGAIVTNMRNFPLSRGTVAGILKAYGGLSAAVFTAIYAGLLYNSSTKLLLFLTLGIPIVCISLMFFVRPCTPSLENDEKERGHFLFVQIASVILGIYLLTTTLVNEILPVSNAVSYIFAFIMVLILLAPLAIPIKMTLFPTEKSDVKDLSSSVGNGTSGDPELSTSTPLLPESPSEANIRLLLEDAHESDVGMLLAEGEGAIKKKRKPKRGDDFKFHEVLVKADFWLLFLAYFVGVGTGVTVLNNLAQIGIAAGINDTTILLCLFGFFNFLGRLIGGIIPEQFVRSRSLPRPTWMACAQVVMAGTYLLFTFAPDIVLYGSTALLGICYGVQISIMVPTASELFGLKHLGVIYNFIDLGNPIGAVLFSGLLAGSVYDKEAAKQHVGLINNSDVSCLGPECFRLTFLVLAAISVVGSFISMVLTVRIRPVYHMLYAGGSFRYPNGSQR